VVHDNDADSIDTIFHTLRVAKLPNEEKLGELLEFFEVAVADRHKQGKIICRIKLRELVFYALRAFSFLTRAISFNRVLGLGIRFLFIRTLCSIMHDTGDQ